MFLKKVGQPSEIIADNRVFGLANIVENQYVIQLAENPKPATVNQIKTPTIKIWHAKIGHLGYRSLLELSKLAQEIKIKETTFAKICSGCIKGRL